MRLSRLGKVNMALGILGAIGCFLALIAMASESASDVEGGVWAQMFKEESFGTYVGLYVLIASLTSIALISGGFGLTRDRRWGRGVSAAGAALLLLLLVGGNVCGWVVTALLPQGNNGSGPPGGTAVGAIASVLFQVLLAGYAVVMLAKVSRPARAID